MITQQRRIPLDLSLEIVHRAACWSIPSAASIATKVEMRSEPVLHGQGVDATAARVGDLTPAPAFSDDSSKALPGISGESTQAGTD